MADPRQWRCHSFSTKNLKMKKAVYLHLIFSDYAERLYVKLLKISVSAVKPSHRSLPHAQGAPKMTFHRCFVLV